MLTSVGVPVESGCRALGAGSSTPNLAVLFAPAVGLRVPASAASDEPLRPRDDGRLLGRAGRDRAERNRLPQGPRRPKTSRTSAIVDAAPSRRPARGGARGSADAPARRACRRRSAARSIAWYYTPMMLPFSRHLDADVHRLRLHGRAFEIPVRARAAARPRAGADRPRRPRLHRRVQPLRGEEGAATATSTASRRRSTATHFAKARAASFRSPADQAELPASAPRLLRRDRRALRHRPAATGRRRCGPTGRS